MLRTDATSEGWIGGLDERAFWSILSVNAADNGDDEGDGGGGGRQDVKSNFGEKILPAGWRAALFADGTISSQLISLVP